ncbi:lumazine-binding protein [Mycolicibacterium komossense]|uniref:Lumazine-binding protein n=1 Tax=Mycolicibacterium komossense TaxID=1779 RepID=A0ABT3CLB7_9MYCO|nr:lumazine-binding protein [Mycolicibacterium komossense]MCV7230118.1 lumazine-binding protein [Mycolicibacterium komossense]
MGRRDESQDSTGSSPLPFLAALVIIIVVLIVIGLFALNRGDGLSEEDQVSRAAIAQNDALQRQNYPDLRGYTCAAVVGTEADMVARQRDSVAKHGARYVDGVTGVAVDGDHATGTVIYHFEKAPDDKINTPTTFTREDGVWKVCSPTAA